MRAFIVFCCLLAGMAAVDLYFSARLNAEFKHSIEVKELQRHSGTGDRVLIASLSGGASVMDAPPSSPADTAADLVESALNSRYMQWGAVGVMLLLFVWIITKHLPNQDRLRAKEAEQIRASFLKSIEKRDEQYLTELAAIRHSVESHVQRVIDAKEKQAEALHDLASEIRMK